jgi:hypothetical protein
MKLKKNIAISESGFVFNATNGDSFSANDTGAEVLRKLQEGLSVKEVAEALMKKYDVAADTCEKDVFDFAKILEQFKLAEK